MTHGGAHGGIRGSPFPMQRRPDGAPVTQCLGSVVLGGGKAQPYGVLLLAPYPGVPVPPPPPPSPPFRACLGLPPQNHMLLEHKMQRPPLGPKRCCPAGAACPITPKKAAPPTQLNGHPGTPRPPLHIDGAE